MKQRIILASHGSLAEGMLSAVDMILTSQGDKVLAYGLDTYETPQEVKRLIVEEMAKDKDCFYTVICDIKGGSVCNELMTLCSESNVCVISGMNLGLVLEVIMAFEDDNLKQTIQDLVTESKDGIEYFDYSVIMGNKEEEEDELW